MIELEFIGPEADGSGRTHGGEPVLFHRGSHRRAMILLKAAHPPAGATTLIVSLGIVTKPFYLLVIEVAVALLALQAIVINRAAGVDYPVWARLVPAPRVEPEGKAV